MIFTSDDYGKVREVDKIMDQNIEERIQKLNQEDRVLFSQLTNPIQQHSLATQQLLNKYYLQKEEDQQLFLRNIKEQHKIQQNEESNSDTQSLSIISDEYQFNFIDNQQWQQVLHQYGNLFKGYQNYYVIKTDKSLDYFSNINKYVQQNYYNKVYLGLITHTKQLVVVKEQELCNQSLMDAAQQFVIHNEIYQLYPNNFLKLHLPVYIEIENEKLKFISFSEKGLIDLYQYSQQRLIPDLELQLIFQQIFEQIQLLHTHNIAHRDIKPQNIIYVENKGWVLCDFEYSLKYINVIDVYDITGTYAFLLPDLQQKSKMQGVQLKQNLLQNDLYAFAITLIVIKYQIKTQEQIDQYLKQPKDPFVEFLLKSVYLEYLHKYMIIYEIKYIRPQLQQNKNQNQDQKSQNQEQIEFLIIIGKLNQVQLICDQCKGELLNYIDEILKQNNSYFNYYHIQCYYQIPKYVNQLKNIIKYKQLRQRKYWNNVFHKLYLMNNQDQMINCLIFMYYIGLKDLYLHYAQQYINLQYNFSIHLQIIDILEQLRNYEEVQNQFNILLKHREFQQMNQFEQNLFIGFIVKVWYNYLTKSEIEYVKSLGIQFVYANDIEFLLNHYYDDKFFEKTTEYIEKIIQFYPRSIKEKFKIVQSFVNNVIMVKDLQTSLKLLEELKQKLLKYQCPTLDWQDLIVLIIRCKELLGHNNNKKLIKNMNYVMMFNSENTFQQDQLKLLKYQIQLYQNSCKKSFKIIIIHKIYQQVKNLSKCFNEFYIYNAISVLQYILNDSYYFKELFFFFSILVYVSKQNELSQVLTQHDQEQLQELIIQCYRQTKNENRFKLLAKNKQKIVFNIRNLVKYKKIKIMNQEFLKNQYIYS